MVASWLPWGGANNANGRQTEPEDIRKRPQGGPIGAQRAPKRRPGMASGTPWDALGRPGATIAKTSSGDHFFRLKNGASFGTPGVEFSTNFASNFRIEFCRLFDAVLAAKLAPKAGQREAKGCQRRGQSLPWRPLSLPFSSFGRVRRTPRKCWQGQYKRKVGRPRVGHGNALRQAKQGQGRPRHARQGQVRPKATLGCQTWPPKARPGRPREARKGPEGHAGKALKANAFLARPLRPRGGRWGESRSGPRGGGGFHPPLKDGSPRGCR